MKKQRIKTDFFLGFSLSSGFKSIIEGQCASLDTKSAGLQGTRFQLGSGSSLDKHNDDWDKTGPVSQILLSITSHENYNYRQMGSRSARHGRTLWSWPSG